MAAPIDKCAARRFVLRTGFQSCNSAQFSFKSHSSTSSLELHACMFYVECFAACYTNLFAILCITLRHHFSSPPSRFVPFQGRVGDPSSSLLPSVLRMGNGGRGGNGGAAGHSIEGRGGPIFPCTATMPRFERMPRGWVIFGVTCQT